ncbi:DUF4231 domain-containing protein [Allosaccharopolyspora coralli]|uniref:DUF4231 domain-containing protein n=1 Tax=Allosaccharopolyspora coralli TaxID=2665642 RepID=A0A5Q3Q4J0_9PSEU|nr:DUF4231 domain-containing protein [Allosaccharopolyspora coralli]QGK68416.1 DUF4231 domain-containing protein [Allosaccharopolyspora coralli]
MQSAEVSPGIVGGGVIPEGAPPQDLERRIAERSEKLYHVRLVQRILMIWAYPGNLVILGVSVASVAVLQQQLAVVVPLAVLVPAASLVASARALYRQHFRIRSVHTQLKSLRTEHEEHLLDELGVEDLLAAHKRYRSQLPDVIARYRVESRSCRRKHNAVQSVVIVGSILSAAATTASLSLADARVPAVVLSLLVAVSAAFGGYAKYRERSVNLQQTADALEREYESVELRVGRYRRFGTEREAYAEFAHEVETLRAEQAKRRQHWGQVFVDDDTAVVGR